MNLLLHAEVPYLDGGVCTACSDANSIRMKMDVMYRPDKIMSWQNMLLCLEIFLPCVVKKLLNA
jgi:hypothetical protein